MEHSTFALWSKWFWIGIVAATLNPLAGLIFGIGVITEKEQRKEGMIIIGWSIVWWSALAIVGIKMGGLSTTIIQPQQ